MPSATATQPDIVYTKTDEAPALATYSFLPIVQHFARAVGVEVGTVDISLAGRILSQFPEYLKLEQQQSDDLAALGELVQKPEANIVKLPNISASVPQLQEAIKELQGQGYDIPDYPADPTTDEEKKIKATYSKVLGSAVNPVLREGNSDRRSAKPVKEYAQKNPHKMGAWPEDSQTHVSHMDGGDFFGNEQSVTTAEGSSGEVHIEFVDENGEVTVLTNPEKPITLEPEEVADTTFMSIKALRAEIKNQMADAKEKGIIFSLHVKATMMKISDPVIFGHVVEVFLEDVFNEYGDLFEQLGVNSNNGISDIEKKIAGHEKEADVKAAIAAAMEKGPRLYAVDSDKGVTNLHSPNDVIIDASIPPIMRSSGQAWDMDGKQDDVNIFVPDRSYAFLHKAVADKIREKAKQGIHLDPRTMGRVDNVGLMAKKAEEYGSHDKTFMAPGKGQIRVVDADGNPIKDADGNELKQQNVEEGDIWRMCQTKDEPVQDWVRLAVERAHKTGNPIVFWLDKDRPHDAELIKKVNEHLKDHDTEGHEIHTMSVTDATNFTMERLYNGEDTIAVSGNVLRDHLTDMFPILELGTSAKMLSIVPLLKGGGLFETGAGGSAPKHVQQFEKENHLRWDSLGEFLALVPSLEKVSETTGNKQADILAKALDRAISKFLDENKSPSRKVNELDNRGSHYYLALYWAQELAAQKDDAGLSGQFTTLAANLAAAEETIIAELEAVQGEAVDLGGYFRPDPEKAQAAMRPSATLNALIPGVAA